MIKETTVDAVRELPVEDIIGKYVDLKKKGASLEGCCPFHDEKSPSFKVTPAKGIYKCFGCGKSGDGIRFVQEKLGISFIEAIELLAKEFGIAIEYDEQEPKEQRDFKKSVMKALRAAQIRYKGELTEDIKNYLLVDRKLTEQTINDWNIGYAPDNSQFMIQDIINAGYWSYALAAGIVKGPDVYNENEKSYSFFRNRILFPIENKNGDVVGFGGRKLPSDESDSPKYINLPGTIVYDKAKVLFGLSRARKTIYDLGFAILVEGYLDVIKMHQSGWQNVVASCGTALTEQHASVLKSITKKIVIMRDGDNAGKKASLRDVEILTKVGINVSVLSLPEGDDPDTLCDKLSQEELDQYLSKNTRDGLEWVIDGIIANHTDDSSRIEQVADWLSMIDNEIKRGLLLEYAKKKKINVKLLEKAIRNIEDQDEIIDDQDDIPDWIRRDPSMLQQIYSRGFVQQMKPVPGRRVGMYFRSKEGTDRRTNFAIVPHIHVLHHSNPRRIVEVFHEKKNMLIELEDVALVGMDSFKRALINKGPFFCEPTFSVYNFGTVISWMIDEFKDVKEITSLGWQAQAGFFAFADCVVTDDDRKTFDDMGVISIGSDMYFSPSISRANIQPGVKSIYENDAFLKYVEPATNLNDWINRFCKVYGNHAPYGIAFLLISLFKDVVQQVTKIPHLYSYGPKGSGKSAMGESLMWFCFSGKDSKGELIRGINLNPGQISQYAFNNSLERFANLPRIYNEYDPYKCHPWVQGTFKSMYDNEGREIGSGDSFKKRKTEIQQPLNTAIIIGQYIDTTDDGAVASRSILLQFELSKNEDRTEEEKMEWAQLHELELKGLSGLMGEVLKLRPFIKKSFKSQFNEAHRLITRSMKDMGARGEMRTLNNYALVYSIMTVFSEHVSLPFKMDAFYDDLAKKVKWQSEMLVKSNALTIFFDMMAFLITNKRLTHGREYKIGSVKSQWIKKGSEVEQLTYSVTRQFIFIRLKDIYPLFAQQFNQMNRKNNPPDMQTIEIYLKDSRWFIGLSPRESFDDCRTSCYVMDYEQMLQAGIVLNHGQDSYVSNNTEQTENSAQSQFSFENQENVPEGGNDIPF